MYSKILVPHAGTPAGDDALRHAIHAARGTAARIIILHIVEEMQRPMAFALAESEQDKLRKSIDEANESIRTEAEREMAKRVQQCKDGGVAAEVRAAIGDAAEIILDCVDKEGVDLVVMAKRRRLRGIKKLLSMGSVSRKIVEGVSCPVLMLDTEGA